MSFEVRSGRLGLGAHGADWQGEVRIMFERIPASDREAWLALRGKDVTASVAGALLGVHEYLSAFQLWALKAGKIKEDPEETPAMRRGTLFEPVAVEILREEHPDWEFHHNTGPNRLYYRDSEARIGATPDLRVVNERGLGNVQIKAVEQSVFRRKWMTPDREVEPPLWIAVQSIVEGHLLGADWIAVAPLVVGFGVELPLIEIPMKQSIVDMVYERTGEFWSMIERGDEPHADYNRDGEAIEKMFLTDDGSEIDLSGNTRAGLIRTLRAATMAEIKKCTAHKEELDAEMKALLGNHAIGKFADGKRVSWKTQTRKAYSVAESTFRVMRYPQDKE